MLMENQSYLGFRPACRRRTAGRLPRCGHARIIDAERGLEAVPVGNQLKLNITQYGKHQRYSYVVSEPADAPAFFQLMQTHIQGTSQSCRRCGFPAIEEKLRIKADLDTTRRSTAGCSCTTARISGSRDFRRGDTGTSGVISFARRCPGKNRCPGGERNNGHGRQTIDYGSDRILADDIKPIDIGQRHTEANT